MDTFGFSTIFPGFFVLIVFFVIIVLSVISFISISNKKWQFNYNNHNILIQNSFFGEKLYIDNELQDEHSGLLLIPVTIQMTGVIKSENGVVENIKVNIGSKIISLSCIVFIDNKLIFRS